MIQENVAPGPLPLGVSVIDSALLLFGSVFPHVAMKHRLQMLKHFDDCVRQAGKNTQRQEAIQINVFTALVCALKGACNYKNTQVISSLVFSLCYNFVYYVGFIKKIFFLKNFIKTKLPFLN